MEKNLAKGSALRNIVTFSAPFLLANLLQTLYGMADLFIVGQFNGAASISGVSIGSQVMHMLTVMIIGLTMGTTVRIGHAVGRHDLPGTRQIVGNSIVLMMGVSVILAVILFFAADGIAAVMLTPPVAMDETRLYLQICFLGLPLICAYNVISAIFRGYGDSRTPMYFVLVACICNILLDYLFIGGCGMRAAGAAAGTVAAQGISVLFALYVTVRRNLVELSRSDFQLRSDILDQVIRTGLPICLQDGCIQISFVIITVIANSRGVEIAAAVGITEKIIGFFFLVPSSLLASVSAICRSVRGCRRICRRRRLCCIPA